VVSNTKLASDVSHAQNHLLAGDLSILDVAEDALLRVRVKTAFGDGWEEVRRFLIEELQLGPRDVAALGNALLDVPKVNKMATLFKIST